MAGENGAIDALTAEERLAARLIETRGLCPPVDVEELVREYAEVERDTIPGDVDAVSLKHRGFGLRPLVILQAGRREKRVRFTLGHELGHLLIPWHIGNVSCHADPHDSLADIYYGPSEAEANRFASELLLPTAWVKERIDGVLHPIDALQRLRIADTSLPAMTIKLYRLLPPGHAYALVGASGIVMASGASPGTPAKSLIRRHVYDPERYRRCGGQCVTSEEGSQTLHCWRFDNSVELVESDDERTPTAMLTEFLHDLFHTPEEAKKWTQKINGVIGATNRPDLGQTPEELYAALQMRFAGHNDGYYRTLMEYDEFRLFLSRRATEVVHSQAAKRSKKS